jgi:hypothetical protein
MTLIAALITALAVVVGVAFAEWLARLRQRRDTIEQAAVQVAILVPHVTAQLAENWNNERDLGVGGSWWAYREQLVVRLQEVRTAARWPMRNHKQIRTEVDDLTARTAAAEFRLMLDKRELTGAERGEIMPHDLMRAIFPHLEVLDAEIAFYRAHGFTADRPPKR